MSKQTNIYSFFTKSPSLSRNDNHSASGDSPLSTIAGKKSKLLNKSTNRKISKAKEFDLLDIVWAKLEGYPWWPALIVNSPDGNCRHGNKIHVQFFDNPPTRGFIKKFEKPDKAGIPPCTDEAWIDALKEGEHAASLAKEERKTLIIIFENSDEDEMDGGSDKSKENFDGNLSQSSEQNSSILNSADEPVKKRRKVVIVSDDDVSEDEYKPDRSSTSDDSGSSGVEEKTVSDMETESEVASPVKAPRCRKETGKSLKTPDCKPSSSMVASPVTPKVSKGTKSKLALFASKDTPSKETASSGSDWPHTKFKFLQSEFIMDKGKRKPGDFEYCSRTLYIPDDFLSKQTPAMRQWWLLKSDHYDTVLFFKMGKFYELFHMDAVLGVQELGLVMMKGDHAHVGFPEISYGRYSSSLIERGYKVARIEQTETPEMMEQRCKQMAKTTKFDKVVKRELCQKSSKGTRIISVVDGTIDEEATLYLLAVTERIESSGNKHEFGVAFIDTTVGTFYISQFNDDRHYSRLRTLMAHYPPVQILIERGKLSKEAESLLSCSISSGLFDVLSPEKEFWSSSKTLRFLLESSYFKDENDEVQWPCQLKKLIGDSNPANLTASSSADLAISSLGALIWYLKDCYLEQQLLTQKKFEYYTPIDSITSVESTNATKSLPAFLADRRSMVLDGITLKNLEIFNNSANGSLYGTLIKALNHCHTPFGKRMLRHWICSPLCDPSAINSRLDALEFLQKNLEFTQKVMPLLKSLPDLERILPKIHSQGLKRSQSHPDSRAIFFENIQYSRRKVNDFLSTIAGFKTAVSVATLFEDLCGETSSKLLNQCLRSTVNGGKFTELSNILSFFDNAFDHELAKKEGKIIPRQGVDKEYDDAVLKMQVTQEELNDYLKEQCKHFGAKVVYWGSDRKRYQLEVPEHACKHAGDEYELVSQKKGYKRFWTSATKEFLCTVIASEEAKETALKDIARRIFEQFDKHYKEWSSAVDCIAVLDVLMSLAYFSSSKQTCRPEIIIPTDSTHGCYVPAEKCILSPVDRIFTRLGASDRIMMGESTFFVELAETSAIIQHATCHSLVLVDELGRGTATYDGTAIAAAVVDVLVNIGCRTLFSTHYHSLVDDFNACAGISLGHMACMVEGENEDDPSQETITFLYKFVSGPCPKSYGFNAARLASLPDCVIRKGSQKAKELEVKSTKQKFFRKLISNNCNEVPWRGLIKSVKDVL